MGLTRLEELIQEVLGALWVVVRLAFFILRDPVAHSFANKGTEREGAALIEALPLEPEQDGVVS